MYLFIFIVGASIGLTVGLIIAHILNIKLEKNRIAAIEKMADIIHENEKLKGRIDNLLSF